MSRSVAILVALGAALCASLLSYALSLVSIRLARRAGVVKQTGGRHIHAAPVPEWGGLGIAVTLIIVALGAYLIVPEVFVQLSFVQILGYLAGVAILLIGGLIDDKKPLPAKVQILFPIVAALCVIASKTGIVQVTHPLASGGFSLVWWKVGGLSLPSDALTFVWIVAATYATKVLDGLDGLVTGEAVIGASIVGALTLSTAFFQPAVAIFAAIVGGAFLGFLPRNAHPAKQFLGESGSTIAGFSLAVLSILSSAKVAVALAVLAIPMSDVALVMIGRIVRGVPWYKGDNTHLHFRLLQAGLSQRSAVLLLWGVSFASGLLALTLQTRGKIFLIVTLVASTALASFVAGLKSIQKQK